MATAGMPSHDFSLHSRLRRGGNQPQRRCACKGCEKDGTYRAPSGRGATQREYWFCLNHVKEYNANWNYFDGCSRTTFQIRGHETTANSHDAGATSTQRPRQRRSGPSQIIAPLSSASRQALVVLGLGSRATAADVRRRFREQVKQLHPDLNGGHQVNEKRLRAVIWAWSKLRTQLNR